MSIKIFACGDMVIEKQRDNLISEELKEIIKDCDIAFCNLEGPISSGGTKIPKVGAYLQQDKDSVRYLVETGFRLFSLANNHMLDFGEAALCATFDEIARCGADYIGAGIDFNTAYGLKIYELDSMRIGFLAFAESGLGVLKEPEEKKGFAWINSPAVNGIVSKARNQVDFLIISAHAGAEEVPLPLIEWRSRYRELCDLGADIIIGHHPHVPQGVEQYNNSRIFYSLGNFYFDFDKYMDGQDVSYSILLELSGKKCDFKIFWHKKICGTLKIIEDAKFNCYLQKLNNILGQDYENLLRREVIYLYQNRYKRYDALDFRYVLIDLLKFIFSPSEYLKMRKMIVDQNCDTDSHRYIINNAKEAKTKKIDYGIILELIEMYKELGKNTQ